MTSVPVSSLIKWGYPALPFLQTPHYFMRLWSRPCETGQWTVVGKNESMPHFLYFVRLLQLWLEAFWGRLASNTRILEGFVGGYFLCLPWRTSRVAPSCSPHSPRPALRLTRIAGHGPSFSTLQALLRSAEAVPRDSQPQGGANGRCQYWALRPGSPKPGQEEGADELAC